MTWIYLVVFIPFSHTAILLISLVSGDELASAQSAVVAWRKVAKTALSLTSVPGKRLS
jgi:hypothetical protein